MALQYSLREGSNLAGFYASPMACTQHICHQRLITEGGGKVIPALTAALQAIDFIFFVGTQHTHSHGEEGENATHNHVSLGYKAEPQSDN